MEARIYPPSYATSTKQECFLYRKNREAQFYELEEERLSCSMA
jgi:hypothetical protein